jgi:glycosyltransferase involved in cell wall biosynthesis
VNLEAVNFLVPLETKVRVAFVSGIDCFCPGFPQYYNDSLSRICARKMDTPEFWVSHKPPQNWPSFPYIGNRRVLQRPKFVIGRAMSEWAPISRRWAAQHKLVDEVWVPTAWHAEVFRSSGIPREKVQVIPEAIDTRLYNPSHVTPLDLDLAEADFKFLSVFKLEPRKGWDVLLDAYWHEFKATDAVVLIVHTYMYTGPSKRDPALIEQQFQAKALELGFQDDEIDQLARVKVVCTEYPASNMPKLYRTADAFVLPSRGEGWGLPVEEAMAMGLPVIATNFSGLTALIDDVVAYPLRIDGLEPVTFREYNPSGTERWAKPSVEHLRSLMRRIFTNRDEAKRKGALAREKIVANFNQERVASLILNRLVALKANDHRNL